MAVTATRYEDDSNRSEQLEIAKRRCHLVALLALTSSVYGTRSTVTKALAMSSSSWDSCGGECGANLGYGSNVAGRGTRCETQKALLELACRDRLALPRSLLTSS